MSGSRSGQDEVEGGELAVGHAGREGEGRQGERGAEEGWHGDMIAKGSE